MGLKDRFVAALGKRMAGARAPSADVAPLDEMPDMYEGIKSVDQDMYTAAVRMQELADDIVAENPAPANVESTRARVIESGNKAALDWMNVEFRMPSFLTESYSKSWSDTPAGKDMITSVAKAIAVSDSQTAKALQQGIDLIAIAASAMLVHGFFSFAQNPDSAVATRKAAEAAATAKTYVLGL